MTISNLAKTYMIEKHLVFQSELYFLVKTKGETNYIFLLLLA